MKFISLLLICILPLASCQPPVIPAQKYEDIPIDPGPQRKPVPSEKRQRVGGLSNTQIGLVFVTAAIAYAAWNMSHSSRGDCNDCKGDGIVHKGDPHTRIYVFKRAYSCPLCRGDGHL